jgi:hypothetical protein
VQWARPTLRVLVIAFRFVMTDTGALKDAEDMTSRDCGFDDEVRYR